MRQTGTIRELNDDHIIVGCGRTGGCETCSSTMCGEGDESVFEVSNPRKFDIGAGDSVEIYLDPKKTILAGFLVLILPLILFGVGFFIASKLTESEAIRAVAGILGLVSGFGLGYLRKRVSGDEDLPEIVAINPSVLSREAR